MKAGTIFLLMIELLVSTTAYAKPKLSTLYTFAGTSDGAYPGQLSYDRSGNLYGATASGGSTACSGGCGTIFRITPPAKGGTAWTETTLYSFIGQADGAFPNGVIVDKAGDLFGTAYQGGNLTSCSGGCGTVFELTPPVAPQTAWTETTIHAFDGAVDGDFPYAPELAADSRGNLFGTTLAGPAACHCGTVFELQPPKAGNATWTNEVLYQFSGQPDGDSPWASLVVDPSGHLFGTTNSGGTADEGTVFEVAPPAKRGGTWSESIIYSFQGGADGQNPAFEGVIQAGEGLLYGSTVNIVGSGSTTHGTVYSLTPPAGGAGWTHTILYAFAGAPDGSSPTSIVLDTSGNIDGVTAGGGTKGHGTVFQLIPPTPSTSWSETQLYNFTGGSDEGDPFFVVLRKNKLFGTTQGSSASQYGSVFGIAP
jgi:uncharacterized repeat protein (TIGR03803 family)